MRIMWMIHHLLVFLYLFESDEPAPEFVKGTNGGSGSVGGKKPSEMTYTELCDYMAQNPGAEI